MATLLRFFTIVLVALLAGTSFGIWMGFNPANFTASTYVELQQNMIGRLNALMISLVVVATLLTIASAFVHRKDKPAFTALLIAAACLFACMLITRFGNKPLQDTMLQWNASALPSNWIQLRDNWWSFHVLRTLTELIALCLITWTTIKKGNTMVFTGKSG